MSGYATNYGGNAALEHLLRTTPVYLALHETEPGYADAGHAGSEFAGGGYTRQKCWWTPAGNKTTALGGGYSETDAQINKVVFQEVPDAVLRWFGIWNSPSGSTGLLFAIQRTLVDGVTPDPLPVLDTQSVTVPASDLVIGPW
jgi:hypothetical protein